MDSTKMTCKKNQETLNFQLFKVFLIFEIYCIKSPDLFFFFFRFQEIYEMEK